MISFFEFLTDEQYLTEGASATKGRHLTHIEDLPFSQGDEGVEHVANILDDMNTMLSGKQKATFNAPKAKSFVAGKFDGAPAIIFGVDPQTKKFFVASKSAFNKTPKINYTMADIERNHGDVPGLANKLRQALLYLPSVAPKKGVYQGDFMYDKWDIKKDDKSIEWTPNTITYKVKPNSEEGRKAAKAKIGLVVHTKYEGKTLADLVPTPYVDTESFGENPDVHLMPAKVDMNPENWRTEDRAKFTNELENAKIVYKRMGDDAFDHIGKHEDTLNRYINQTVKGQTKPEVDGYVDFLTKEAEKTAGQFKTAAKKESVRRQYTELIQHAQNQQKTFKSLFAFHAHIQNAKGALMNGLRQNSDYEFAINGKKVGPEGYVVYREGQDAVKLVDRKEFSKMNFEIAKMKQPTYPVPAPVVFAYGRMNPPTGGHESVINKVRELASKYGAANDIVLSGSTKDVNKNPLDPEQKVKYAKKFFPDMNIRHADKASPDFLSHAARLYAAGHKEFIMVAGPDRAPDFRRILRQYNGVQGKHGFYNFDHIRVVTSARLPGKSGTEMRGFVKKGNYAAFRRGLPNGIREKDAQQLYNDLKKKLIMKEETITEANYGPGDWGWGLPKKVDVAFKKLAEQQRGKPERAMTDAQKIMRGGMMNGVIELVGDLTNRISPAHEYNWAVDETLNKIDRALRDLNHRYGFEKEVMENWKSNAEHDGQDEEEFIANAKKALKKYVHEHEQLPVYNEVQWLARQAAIDVGNFDFNWAAMRLDMLKDILEHTPERTKEHNKDLSQYEPPGRLRQAFHQVERGPCKYSWQRAADRSRCGKRASSLKEESLNELSSKILKDFKYRRGMTPQRTVKDMKKVWQYGIWRADDRLEGKFRTKNGYKPYKLDDSNGWLDLQKQGLLLKENITSDKVKTFYRYNDTLNPVIWDGDVIKPRVWEKLHASAKLFIDFLKLSEKYIKDIVITGSCANFNWTDHSDIDLHVLYDKEAVEKDFNFEYLNDYLQNKRRLFNDKHKITIRGFEVEFYPQGTSDAHYSPGVYSLIDKKWIKHPEHIVPTINDEDVKIKSASLMNDIDNAGSEGCPSIEVSRELVQKLLKMRKSGLEQAGEYSIENLVFKTLRGNGYIEKLIVCIQKGIDKEYSIYEKEKEDV